MRICDVCLDECIEFEEAFTYCYLCGRDICADHTGYIEGSPYCPECTSYKKSEESRLAESIHQSEYNELHEMWIEAEKKLEQARTLVQEIPEAQDSMKVLERCESSELIYRYATIQLWLQKMLGVLEEKKEETD